MSRSGRRDARPRSPASPRTAIRQAAEWWGTAKTSFLLHARGIEHHTHGVQNCLGAINIVLASGRIGRPGLRLRAPSPARPTARAAASMARSAISFPARATSPTPSIAPTSPASGASNRDELPQPASMPTRSSARSTAARSRGCCASASIPRSRCRTTTSSPGCSNKLEFYVAIDFFLNETARHADIVLPGLAAGGGRRHGHQRRGPRHQDQQGRRLPRRGAAGLADHPGHRPALGRPHGFHVRRTRARSSRNCASPRQGGVADYSGITYEKIEQAVRRLLAVRPRRQADRSSRHAAALRAGLLEPGRQGRGPFYFPDGKARFNVAPYRRRPRTSTPSIRSS